MGTVKEVTFNGRAVRAPIKRFERLEEAASELNSPAGAEISCPVGTDEARRDLLHRVLPHPASALRGSK